ncbi:hypothetical protein B0T26DRAFT_673505 [Lasiosphaeria miniovina]|uniref:Secreted protein n=1 Tax=Lasiosphaeria miniovina TaxID=1954250 RepID=A0AA40DYZ8_9PEZI|nr:uncharacterized protein B0T26DRAFT_673505 [Lasiosphaeria miniovina]KAK0721714.1 hypothetical protein B0T26DRAFT_673505 [Lasiosphaeria miniovina]
MILVSLLFFLGCTAAAQATDIDPVPRLTSRSGTYSGNGCPQGSVATSISTSNSTTGTYQLLISLDRAIPSIGPGSIPSDKSKLCSLKIDLGLPAGWRARLGDGGLDFRGWFYLPDNKTTGTMSAQYCFATNDNDVTKFTNSSPRNQSSFIFSIVGPLVGSFVNHTESSSGAHSGPCGNGTLNVVKRISATSRSASSGSDGYVGPDPDPSEQVWTFVSRMQVLKC